MQIIKVRNNNIKQYRKLKKNLPVHYDNNAKSAVQAKTLKKLYGEGNATVTQNIKVVKEKQTNIIHGLSVQTPAR